MTELVLKTEGKDNVLGKLYSADYTKDLVEAMLPDIKEAYGIEVELSSSPDKVFDTLHTKERMVLDLCLKDECMWLDETKELDLSVLAGLIDKRISNG